MNSWTWDGLAPLAPIVSLLINLGALAVAYGRMSQKVDTLDKDVRKNEDDVATALTNIKAFELDAQRRFATSESIARIEEKLDKIANRIDRVVDHR